MSPDIQYFASSGTWVKPPGAVAVDIMGCGGGAGAGFRADGSVIPGGDGELTVRRLLADDLPGSVEVEAGKGGRPGGRDGYALIVTHLAEEAESDLSPMVARPLGRAVESAVDAALAIRSGDIAQARGLLREAERELDLAERRAEAGR